MTSLERTQLAQADLDAATRDVVALLCREDIEELLSLALAVGGAGDVLAFLSTRLPPDGASESRQGE